MQRKLRSPGRAAHTIRMVRRGILAVTGASILLSMSCCVSGALAQRVILLEAGGHARIVNDRFLSSSASTSPSTSTTDTSTGTRGTPMRSDLGSSGSGTTMVSELQRLHRIGAITTAELDGYIGQWQQALATVKRLAPDRAAELEAVVENLHGIAVEGQLEPSRLPALFLTLERNVQWWTQGPLLSDGQRVEFAGSQLVWEYYPGQGIELQELANFGKADGLYTGGPADYPAMKALLSELIPLAAARAGGISWDYYFDFDGGTPPWTSAMTQGTALEALTRAFEAFRDPSYLVIAARALPVLEAPPPAGVSLPTAIGRRFIQYSFAPGADIINAFLQTLIGLYDYAQISDNAAARSLFTQGNAQALAEVPQFNTGAWSLYQPGVEDDLSYHQLVTGFLQELCTRTSAPVYCNTATAFQADLTTPPALQQLTATAPAGEPVTLRFNLSKPSHVGIVISRGTQTVFLTSADFAIGVNAVVIPALSPAGSYGVRIAATDLAGNFRRITSTLNLIARKQPARRRRAGRRAIVHRGLLAIHAARPRADQT